MSSLTNFLKLFKWDTKTDGSQKFNIDKALNENWDKIEENASNVNTALATKSDKKYAQRYVSTAAWYRIAKIAFSSSNSLINLYSKYNNARPQGITFIVNDMYNEKRIILLSSNKPNQFSKLRITTKDNIDYVEAYYNVSVGNYVLVEVLDNNTAIQTLEFEVAEEDETIIATYNLTEYDVNSAIGTLSSLTTTNKTSLVSAINEVNNKKINIITGTEYATSEYIDDKQVYRKRINIGALPNATSKTVEHGLSNIRFVKMPQGYATNSNGLCLALPFSNPTSTNNVSLSVNSSNILISAGTDRSNYSGYVELYYTK